MNLFKKRLYKYNYMYHYTNLESFLKIWSSKSLKFSYSSGLNDINEVSKFYYGEHIPGSFTDTEELRKEVERYKQISLIREIKTYNSGLLPVMWGHYGDKGKGVCLRIDISKIKFPKKLFRSRVSYKKEINHVVYDNSDITKFIKKNRRCLFFTKTTDWSYEKEYRIVSKDLDFLNISGAISEIIISDLFGMKENDPDSGGFRSELFNEVLQPILKDKIRILEFSSNGISGTILKDTEGEQVYPPPRTEWEVDFSD